jgi:hypothetical protein
VALGVAAALLFTGCGDEFAGLADDGVLVSDQPVDEPYDGPLYVEPEDEHGIVARTGAAGLVVECATPVRGGFQQGVYGEGATADTLAEAFDTARSEWVFDGAYRGYRLERDDGDRVLFTFAVGDQVKQALIMRDGPATEGAGGPGWYVESWARCDLSELPDEVAADNGGTQIWEGPDGTRQPTTEIVSYPGPAHCDWQDSTFLYLGDEQHAYVRKPPRYLMSDYFGEPFRSEMPLPSDAVDTGYARNGDRLWLSPDGLRAYVGTPEVVELWPRTVQRLGCE